jgi:hypothetical protein
MKIIIIYICSGSDGRNSSLQVWVRLSEHVCTVGREQFYWCRSDGKVYWPGQWFQRSGLYILKFQDQFKKMKSKEQSETDVLLLSFVDQQFHMIDTTRHIMRDFDERTLPEKAHVSKVGN